MYMVATIPIHKSTIMTTNTNTNTIITTTTSTAIISFLYGGVVTMTEEDEQQPLWPIQCSSYTKIGIAMLNSYGYMIR